MPPADPLSDNLNDICYGDWWNSQKSASLERNYFIVFCDNISTEGNIDN